jgi:hypothetical protein
MCNVNSSELKPFKYKMCTDSFQLYCNQLKVVSSVNNNKVHYVLCSD